MSESPCVHTYSVGEAKEIFPRTLPYWSTVCTLKHTSLEDELYLRVWKKAKQHRLQVALIYELSPSVLVYGIASYLRKKPELRCKACQSKRCVIEELPYCLLLVLCWTNKEKTTGKKKINLDRHTVRYHYVTFVISSTPLSSHCTLPLKGRLGNWIRCFENSDKCFRSCVLQL